MSPAQIRPVRHDDLDALYDICLRTGNSGQDGTAFYEDPRLVGEVYAAPYAVLQPTWPLWSRTTMAWPAM